MYKDDGMSEGDMRTLLTTLNELDHASLDAKRKLTIPFVKEALKL